MTPISFPAGPLQGVEWTPVEADKVVSGAPQQAYQILYSKEGFTAGLYECTSGKWRVDYAGEDEFCTLIEGTVRLEGNGVTHEYAAPQSFLIPAGFVGTWEAVTRVRKYFVIHEGAA